MYFEEAGIGHDERRQRTRRRNAQAAQPRENSDGCSQAECPVKQRDQQERPILDPEKWSDQQRVSGRVTQMGGSESQHLTMRKMSRHGNILRRIGPRVPPPPNLQPQQHRNRCKPRPDSLTCRAEPIFQ